MLISPPLSPLVDTKESPQLGATKLKTMEPFSQREAIALQPRFAQIKKCLVSGHAFAITSSWRRLLWELKEEIDLISSRGSAVIPTIDFADIDKPACTEAFSHRLRKRGVAIIRNVVPRDTALAWKQDTLRYISKNPHTKAPPSTMPQLVELYWSPAQVKARVHPNLFAAQRFAMRHWTSSDPSVGLATSFPVAYADRIQIRKSGSPRLPTCPQVGGGSVERWEQDGYGRANTYEKVFSGKWEDYDPWDGATRVGVTSDLYNGEGSCSVFRMFQGWLALSSIAPREGGLLVCPMLRAATAYFLLRPFFSPTRSREKAGDSFLDAANWTLDTPQNSILHGALPSYAQELNGLLHPHLQLGRSLVRVPALRPGDYLIWHPDLIFAVDGAHEGPLDSAAMYVPACPLTQTNALYLCRQRKAFLLGRPGPDFGAGSGESNHAGRPGVQDVSEAGGEDGLRAMGLLPWDEEDADSDAERRVLAVANAILFPDRYDMI
jgi:hypothetical protein